MRKIELLCEKYRDQITRYKQNKEVPLVQDSSGFSTLFGDFETFVNRKNIKVTKTLFSFKKDIYFLHKNLHKNEFIFVEGIVNSKSESNIYLTIKNIYHCLKNQKIEVISKYEIPSTMFFEEKLHYTQLNTHKKFNDFKKGDEIICTKY
eukprot:gene10394-2923_t